MSFLRLKNKWSSIVFLLIVAIVCSFDLARADAESQSKREQAAQFAAERQAQRAAALKARLEAREEAKARAEAESAKREQIETEERVKAVAATAARRKAREEARFAAELERAATREAAVRAREDAETEALTAAVSAAEDEKEKAKLQARLDKHVAQTSARRASSEAGGLNLKSRRDARLKMLDEREKLELERAALSTLARPAWKISAGVIHRAVNSRTSYENSYSQSYPISAKSRGVTRSFSPAGDTLASANRDYIDGYVHKDEWTDLDGATWDWGYNSGSQVRNDMVVLRWLERSRTEFTREISVFSGERGRDSDSDTGVYLRAERILKQVGPMDYGVRLDFSRMSFSAQSDFSTFSDSQNWSVFRQYARDEYSLAGSGITPASQPYQGGSTTPRVSINNTPDIRTSENERKISSGSYDAFNSVSESLDFDFSTLSLGMSVVGNYGRFYLSGAAGPSLTMVDADVAYDEALFESVNGGSPLLLASWRETGRNTQYNLGVFLQGELGLKLFRGFELSVFGRYDWIENVSGAVGRARYVVNPEGGSFGGAVHYAF